jgi:hypothetical protein
MLMDSSKGAGDVSVKHMLRHLSHVGNPVRTIHPANMKMVRVLHPDTVWREI